MLVCGDEGNVTQLSLQVHSECLYSVAQWVALRELDAWDVLQEDGDRWLRLLEAHTILLIRAVLSSHLLLSAPVLTTRSTH